MKTSTSTTVEKSKSELISIKRKITEAGRIMDKIKADEKRLADLKKEIRAFEVEMATEPALSVVLVSGEYVAELGPEKLERVTGPKQNLTLFGYLGLEKFMDLASFSVTEMRKEVGDTVFDTICPEQYSGKGRTFSLKPKK